MSFESGPSPREIGINESEELTAEKKEALQLEFSAETGKMNRARGEVDAQLWSETISERAYKMWGMATESAINKGDLNNGERGLKAIKRAYDSLTTIPGTRESDAMRLHELPKEEISQRLKSIDEGLALDLFDRFKDEVPLEDRETLRRIIESRDNKKADKIIEYLEAARNKPIEYNEFLPQK